MGQKALIDDTNQAVDLPRYCHVLRLCASLRPSVGVYCPLGANGNPHLANLFALSEGARLIAGEPDTKVRRWQQLHEISI